jgi:PAS domain S-box-containing protein
VAGHLEEGDDAYLTYPVGATELIATVRMLVRGRHTESKFQTFLEAAPDAVLIVDHAGRIVQLNAQAEAMFGYDGEQLIGQEVEALLPERFRCEHRLQREGFMARPTVRPMGRGLDLWGLRRDGSEFPVEIALSPLRSKTGALVFSIIRDVTHRRQMEQSLRQALDQAEAANRAKDQFVAVLSHELRVPLTPALTAVQMLETDSTLTPDLRESAGMIRRNVELEVRLIDDLLDLTRISRGKLELQYGDVDLQDTINHVVAICDGEIRLKQLRLIVESNAADHRVRGDVTRLQQVLWNLLRNAAKFTPVGGDIRICTDNPSPGQLSVVIKDSGMGIEPELLPCIFDAFEQGGDGITRQFGGLGLGLALSKELVSLHNGTLTAQSDGRNRGTSFTMKLSTLPASKVDIHQPTTEMAMAASPKACRILLVDDDDDTTTILAAALGRRGHTVRVAGSVASALKAASAEQFDLFITDICLPDGNGRDLMHQLSGIRSIKGIVLSGYGMEEDIQKSKAAGFAVHLTKPVTLKTLYGVIQDVACSE